MKQHFRTGWLSALLIAASGPTNLAGVARAQEAAGGNAPQAADRKQSAVPGANSTVASAGPASASPAAAAPARPSGPSLPSAMLLYRAREYEKAIAEYSAVIAANPSSSNAYAGLARSYLGASKLTDALAAANKGVEIENDNPNAHIALGEVYFRLGRIPEAENEFVPIVKAGQAYARAYLGEARISWASSYYRQAKRLIDLAHKLDSADPDITRFWFRTQISSGSVRVEVRGDKAKEEMQEGDKGTQDKEQSGSTEKGENLRKIVETLSDNQQERHSCRPTSTNIPVELPFEPLMNDPKTYRGMGLKIGINGATGVLLVDTGGSGILLGRKVAERAGVTRVAETHIGGIGDRGDQSGYLGHVDSMRIGGLEFRDCFVEVIDRKNAVGDDGLVGANLFEDFLVDLDFSERKFRLSQLPPLPSEKPGAASTNEAPGLHDRYIAPEMKSYTPVYRFGHDLLVPTKINDSVTKLFILDSGATLNSISPTTAREVTKVASDDTMTIKGLNGSVKNVYRADKATLTFGNLRQRNQDIVGFDTTTLSESLGTEVSGFLGFTTLGMLDIKIDYRDGLVAFIFDPQKWCKGKCR